jgi:hypothetical protein
MVLIARSALLSIIVTVLRGFSSTMVQEFIDCCTIQYCLAANIGETSMARTTPIGISFHGRFSSSYLVNP